MSKAPEAGTRAETPSQSTAALVRHLSRLMLACAIAGTLPLTLWGGGCGQRPVVEPSRDAATRDVRDVPDVIDATQDSRLVDGAPYGGPDLRPSDATDAEMDATADVQPNACCIAGARSTCLPDGSGLIACVAGNSACAQSPSYSYSWVVQGCSNGCVIAGADAGGSGGAQCVVVDAAADLAPSDATGDTATDGAGSDSSDASPDAFTGCCTGAGASTCLADGTTLLECVPGGVCGGGATPYSYWRLVPRTCPAGCATSDAGAGDGSVSLASCR